MAITISKIGFCKYRGNLTSIPTDIENGHGIQLTFSYEWNGDNCTINNIKTRPVEIQLTGEGRQVTILNDGLVENVFKKKKGDPNVTFDITFEGRSVFSIVNGNDFPLDGINDFSSINFVMPGATKKYLTANLSYEYNDNDISYIVEIKDIKIPKTSKYEDNIVFTRNGVQELLNNIKSYPIINIESIKATEKENDDDNDVIWTKYTKGKPCIRIDYGDETKTFSYDDDNTPQTIGHKYVAVGSNITFPNDQTNQASGTIRISIDGVISDVPVYGLSGTGASGVNLSGTTTVAGHLLPAEDNTYDLGGDKDASSKKEWRNLYLSGSLGDSNNYIPNAYITTLNGGNNTSIGTLTSAINNGYFINLTATTGTITNLTATTATITNLNLPAGTGDTAFNLKGGTTAQFLRGNGSNKNPTWSNELTGSITVGAYLAMKGYSGYAPANQAGFWYDGTNKRIKTYNISASANDIDFESYRVFNAVFNDYAECRSTIDLTPGHVVIDQDDGSLACSFARLQPGAQVISDTYGHLMGSTETAKTPIAVAGRVLVYTYQPRENYHAGMAVCSAPDGTVDIMTREEIRDYPDCIVGIVSEIPQYETWGSDNVKVDRRIWIKVK